MKTAAGDGHSANGVKVEGEIERLDDFSVAIRLDNGTRQSWRIVNGMPRVAVTDPLLSHRELLKMQRLRHPQRHGVLVTLK